MVAEKLSNSYCFNFISAEELLKLVDIIQVLNIGGKASNTS